jgi:hypothetical protein
MTSNLRKLVVATAPLLSIGPEDVGKDFVAVAEVEFI